MLSNVAEYILNIICHRGKAILTIDHGTVLVAVVGDKGKSLEANPLLRIPKTELGLHTAACHRVAIPARRRSPHLLDYLLACPQEDRARADP